MSRIRGVDTKPELFVRCALHALGYRFRTHVRGLPGRPDIVFSRRRAVVFVHGCFWHRHGCGKTYTPKSREQFWRAKFAGNVERDQRDQQRLTVDGWRVFLAWQCEIEADGKFMERLVAFLGAPRLPKEAGLPILAMAAPSGYHQDTP